MKTFLAKTIFIACAITPLLSWAEMKEPRPEIQKEGQKLMSPMHRAQEMTPDMLDIKEQRIYYKLGPMYQKIYLNVLTDRQRHMVVIFVRRGVTPYQAINSILKVEERRIENTGKKKRVSPGERAMMGMYELPNMDAE